MSINDNDNYYILEEEEDRYTKEEEQDPDQSPLNFAAYSDEERDEERRRENTEGKERSAVGLLFKLMFNPVEGWKELRRSKITVESLQSGCFYPILAFLAMSYFMEFVYSVNVSLAAVVTRAVVGFVAFFFGYLCIPMVMTWLLKKDQSEKFNESFGKEFLQISLSMQAIFAIMLNLLPMISPILIFLPLWTLYVMFKGIRFFKFPQSDEVKCYILAGVAVIGVPLMIEWGLNEILPY